MIRKFRGITLIFLLCLSFLAHAQDESSTGQAFFWRIQSPGEKGGSEAYIMGAVHLAKPDIYPLRNEIEEAFGKAESLVVELDMRKIDQLEMQELTIKHGFYTDSAIDQHISKDDYELLKVKLGEFQINIEEIKNARPWFFSVLLSNLALAKIGYNANLGIDMYFMNQATGQKKNVLELESAEYQMEIFGSLPDNVEKQILLDSLREDLTAEIDELGRAWLDGDIKALHDLVFADLSAKPIYQAFYEKMYFERNKNMVKKIEEYMEKDGVLFVVVGAGHLVGGEGIIELFEDRGYVVDRL